MKGRFVLLLLVVGGLWRGSALHAQERLTFLYPSPAGSWVIPMVAMEAKYFDREGLSVELVRVGGSTRIVAALIGGSAQLIHAGEPALIPAVARGSDAVIIGAISQTPQHRLIGRPEIKDVKDLKGKTVGITSFGASSDFVCATRFRKTVSIRIRTYRLFKPAASRRV
jgi:ABC-type nitrate/sulfonate/bicarbonate transport system substrate-binding protein